MFYIHCRESYGWHRCLIARTYQGFVNLHNNTNGSHIKMKLFEINILYKGKQELAYFIARKL